MTFSTIRIGRANSAGTEERRDAARDVKGASQVFRASSGEYASTVTIASVKGLLAAVRQASTPPQSL